jgi:hypothetical protein
LSCGSETPEWIGVNGTRVARTTTGRRTGRPHTIEIWFAREVTPEEEAVARRLLDEKYIGWKAGKRLSSWARKALPVAIDL